MLGLQLLKQRHLNQLMSIICIQFSIIVVKLVQDSRENYLVMRSQGSLRHVRLAQLGKPDRKMPKVFRKLVVRFQMKYYTSKSGQSKGLAREVQRFSFSCG
jgi:hypothetical protein